MNVSLHIERLVLEGLPVTASQGALVQAAIETELIRLLADSKLRHLRSGAVEYSAAPPIQLSQKAEPLSLVQQIAHGVHRSVISSSLKSKVVSKYGGLAQ